MLPLLALAMATSAVGLRCRMTGEVLSSCCCGPGDEPQAESPTSVSQAGCCDRLVREVTAAPAEVSTTARVLPERTAPVALVAPSLVLDVVPSVLAVRSEARASIGPPSVRLRLVAKSAFLI
jgi:hypothetical protein